MKRSPIRKKSPARKVMQQIDLLVKAYVHSRDYSQCLKCGKTERLQAAHILPKGRYPRLRYDPLNILTLCVGCHLFWAHKNPVGFVKWVEKEYPGRLDQLEVCAAVARKVDLQELLVYWQEQTDKELEAGQ